jgi:hypothetical protein
MTERLTLLFDKERSQQIFREGEEARRGTYAVVAMRSFSTLCSVSLP